MSEEERKEAGAEEELTEELAEKIAEAVEAREEKAKAEVEARVRRATVRSRDIVIAEDRPIRIRLDIELPVTKKDFDRFLLGVEEKLAGALEKVMASPFVKLIGALLGFGKKERRKPSPPRKL